MLILLVLCVVALLVDSCGCRCSRCRGCSCSRKGCSAKTAASIPAATEDRLKSCPRYKYYCDNGCAAIQSTVRRLCPVTCGVVKPDDKKTDDKKDEGKKDEGKKDEGSKEDSTKDEKFKSQMLAQHNKYRKIHDAPALTYSDKLADFAQNWCNKLRDENSFRHSSGSGYGENLGKRGGSAARDGVASGVGTVDSWYNEIKDYDFDEPGFSHKTGHFTAVVWKKTKQVGCAYSHSSDKYTIWVCCNYSPPGNYRGQFEDNVLEGSYDG